MPYYRKSYTLFNTLDIILAILNPPFIVVHTDFLLLILLDFLKFKLLN